MNTYIVEWNETQEVIMNAVVEADSENEAIDIARTSKGEVLDIVSACNDRDYEATIERSNMNNVAGHLCSKCKRRLFKDTIKPDNNHNLVCAYCGNVLKYNGAYIKNNTPATPEETFEMFG